ncbi:MAG: hypothetical protein DRO88_08595 [Promethearchaeia archaeon]|nr:MAG: hypothetical protein DRO88_08595 [Candidatus Lokiarchaeia archaeon]
MQTSKFTGCAKIAIIANFPNEIRDRAKRFFQQVFKPFSDKLEWEYISYRDLLDEKNFNKAKKKDALILSSSDFIISDPIVQEKMLVEMYLIRQFKGPIFGMCFGHHLLEFMYGADVTEQIPVDFFNSQDLISIDWQNSSKLEEKHEKDHKKPSSTDIKFSPKIEENIGKIVNHPSKIDYIPLFRDDFSIYDLAPQAKVYAKQHKSLPIYGVDLGMNENSPEIAFATAVNVLQKFITYFFK